MATRLLTVFILIPSSFFECAVATKEAEALQRHACIHKLLAVSMHSRLPLPTRELVVPPALPPPERDDVGRSLHILALKTSVTYTVLVAV